MKKLTFESRFLLLILTILPFAVITCIAPPVYILNDDLQIASVLSGAYSGTPDLHTVYMRAPLSFFLSLCYRIVPSIPWLGIFLCGTVVLCAYLILCSVTQETDDEKQLLRSALPAYGAVLLFLLLLYWQPHYTVVAACSGATGIFLLIRSRSGETLRERIMQLLPTFLLLLLCDQIRSQVFFMLLPFVGMALLFCFLQQEKKVDWLKKSLPLWAGFAVVWLGLFGLHQAAYAGAEWQAYLKLNKARTELYDYTLVWESDEAKEYYRQCGVTDEAYPLYRHYDLLPDITVTAERLQKMAEFQEPSRTVSNVQKLKNVLYDLRVHTLGVGENSDLPYAYLLILLYIIAVVVIAKEKKWWYLLPVAGSGCMHFLIYGWLLWRGRAPERVTLSLYMVESFLLMAMVFAMAEKKEAKKGISHWLVMAFMIAALFPAGLSAVLGYREQISVNRCDDVVYSYMSERPEQLFALETSATVNRTVPVFARNDTERNVMLMGGWLYGSPLQAAKMKAFGYTDVQELLTGGECCYVFREANPLLASMLGKDALYDDMAGWSGLVPGNLEAYLQTNFERSINQIDCVTYDNRPGDTQGETVLSWYPKQMAAFYILQAGE
ncbi:MAG: hypothetical protein IKO10_18225 [Lachnospiraceae bacterium]|nr:hypothetical protein [Lachnospiraceae bacterium]